MSESVLEKGLICQFYHNNWEMNSDISSLYNENKSKNACLMCRSDTVHSKDEENSWWLVNFSKPVLVYSYSIFANAGELYTIANWVVYQLDSHDQYIQSDVKKSMDIRNNTKKFAMQTTFKTKSIKIIAGKDIENNNNFVKFQQIEFYGKLFPLYDKNTCKQNIIDIQYIALFVTVTIF